MDGYSLGLTLREAREAKEIELADAVAQLRIHRAILENFEKGEFEITGAPEVQTRGMLRIYARFLALDEESILLQYDQMRIAQEKSRRRRLRRRNVQPATEARPATQPLQAVQIAERRSAGVAGILRALLILLLSLAALAVIGFVTWQLARVDNGAVLLAEPSPTPDLPTNTSMPTPTPLPPSPTASNRAQYKGSGILVSLLLTQRSWLQVSVDGVEQYSGMATAGTLLEYSALSEVRLSAGNAPALDTIWNGQQQPSIGARGQRADMRFTLDGVTVALGPGAEPTELAATATLPPTAIALARPVAVSRPKASPLPTVASSRPKAVLAPTSAAADIVLQPSATPLPSDTLAPTHTPTMVDTPPPTAILPPRVTQAGLPPTKAGAR